MPLITSSPGSAEQQGDILAVLAGTLDHHFADVEVLLTAVTHRSYVAENLGVGHNERLEFLGDSVLGLIVTEYLYAARPDLSEGAMAKARASVVSAQPLARVAARLGIGAALRLGRGEEATGGREKSSILADAFEAVLGAVYLDGGWQAAQLVVLRNFADLLIEATADPGLHDYKTRLQEAAARFEAVPRYELSDEGPDHSKTFRATVSVAGEALGEGEGRSKKEAQQAAAQVAWAALAARAPEPAHEEPALKSVGD